MGRQPLPFFLISTNFDAPKKTFIKCNAEYFKYCHKRNGRKCLNHLPSMYRFDIIHEVVGQSNQILIPSAFSMKIKIEFNRESKTTSSSSQMKMTAQQHTGQQ
jgi:hypothetical protein